MNPAKPIKDLTFKSRFLPSYGANEQLYQDTLEYVDYWQDKLFIIDEKSFKKYVDDNTLKIRSIEEGDEGQFPCLNARKVLKGEQLHNLGFNDGITVDIHGDSTAFEFGKLVDLSHIGRQAKTLYTGGIITSLNWLPLKSGNKQYLAVTVMNDPSGDLNNAISNEQLSIFYNKISDSKPPSELMKTSIQIWELLLDTNELSLYKLLDTTKFGACSNISWIPLEFNTSIGVVGGSFKDGKVHFFKIEPNQGDNVEYLEVHELSICYGLQNPRADTETLAITTYDYLLNDRIIVGFVDGSIAEFILPNYKSNKGSIDPYEEENISLPSFIHNVAETPISGITVGDLPNDKYIIQVNTHGLLNIIFDYDNYQSQRVNSFGSTLRPLYHQQLQVFICLDSYDVAAYTFARHAHERQSLFLKIDGVVTSYGISKYLNHPMVLVAGSYGELFIVNISRKILSPSKTANKTLSPLRLWKLCYNKPTVKGLSLDFEPEPIKPDKSNKITVSPDQVNISCLGWNENLTGSSIYAAGTHCGLLVIEKLDSS